MNRRQTTLACAASLALTAGAAAAPPAHVFVKTYDGYESQTYWDAASVRRIPGGFTFQEIDAGYGHRVRASGKIEEEQVKVALWATVEISCQLRTSRKAVTTRLVALAGQAAPMPALTFKAMGGPTVLGPESPYAAIAEQLCSGGAAPTKGLPNEAAIAAAFEAAFGATSKTLPTLAPPPDILPPPPLALPLPIPPVLEDPPRPAWMEGPHNYTPVATPLASGARLFLDRKTLDRQGNTVEGLSLLMLAPAPWLLTDAAAQRHVRYDCARKTMTVLGQAVWSGYGAVDRIDEVVSPPRGAPQSPAITAEIAAACQPASPDAGPGLSPAISSVAAAITAARAARPTRQRAWTASCLWKSLSTDQRVARSDLWKQRDNAPATDEAPPPYLQPVWEACGVPASEQNDANWALRQKAIQHGAVQRLMNNNGVMIESRLLAAWRTVPEEDRRRFGVPDSHATNQEQAFQTLLIKRITQGLRLKSNADLDLVADYFKCQVVLESELELPPEPAQAA